MDDLPSISEPDTFSLLRHGHRDMVSATAFNSYGDRFGTGSVDGSIKIHNKHKDGSWHHCDTWNAHSSEIIQILWFPTSIYPNLIASLAADGKFRIWAEDPTIPPGTGRRFNFQTNKTVFELSSTSRSPFLSFTIAHNLSSRHTFLALINRSASVFVYENDEPENLELWTEIDSFVACEKPARGEEISFRVAFDPNLQPTYTAILQGVSKDALGLVVASMYTVSVWRTRDISHSVSLGSANTKEFYRAVELKGHRGLVRDVAWAPGNIRGHDVIATACKDGFVRVFQVWTPSNDIEKDRSTNSNEKPQLFESAEIKRKSNPSGIGAGLGGIRHAQDEKEKDGTITHMAKEVGLLAVDEGSLPPWKVEFDADGHLLGSTSDDGKVTLWRREPSGEWAKYSELTMARDLSD
ncbi:hypothetical protein K3495_g6622 [Podosphaera aphanis]|nr:hypothetical protein K3495_g6622 [Podosphaera aphanis]